MEPSLEAEVLQKIEQRYFSKRAGRILAEALDEIIPDSSLTPRDVIKVKEFVSQYLLEAGQLAPFGSPISAWSLARGLEGPLNQLQTDYEDKLKKFSPYHYRGIEELQAIYEELKETKNSLQLQREQGL